MTPQNFNPNLELRAIRDAMIASAIHVCAVSAENGFLLRSPSAVEPKEEISLKMVKIGAEPTPRYMTLILHHCCCDQVKGSCTVYSHLYSVTSCNKVDERVYEVSGKHVYTVKLSMEVDEGIDIVPEEVLETIYIKDEYYVRSELELSRLAVVFGRRNSKYVVNVASLWWRGGSPSYIESVGTAIARKIEEW